MDTERHNCPNCGGQLPRTFRHTRMVGCGFCGSAVLLDGEGLRLAGQRSVMAPAPSILEMGVPFGYRGGSYTPVGHARFAYSDRGHWDEWWVLEAETGEGAWLSADEGDHAFERDAGLSLPVPFAALSLGKHVELNGERLTVTELGEATCLAVRGSLPEVLTIGQRFSYAHLSGSGGKLITAEHEGGHAAPGEVALFEGRWLDPFDIEVFDQGRRA